MALEIASYRASMEISDELLGDELEVEISHQWVADDIHLYWNKEGAEQIVNHLITVFDITPEQRNK
ncbi:MAG: hypothetical protein JKY52_09185 [Flavobacteriales bacterium]|nr:hypothetical protein [Flavobacteriales bacterium]